jgi:hypothetical protein
VVVQVAVQRAVVVQVALFMQPVKHYQLQIIQ